MSESRRSTSRDDATPSPRSIVRGSEFIPAEALPNLKKYRYSGSDFSIVSRYVLKHYWDFVVSLVPMSVAPNRITFIGFVIGMSSTFLLLYFYLFENAVYPPWAWFYTAFSLFAYQTLDAIDGKQARRTGAGSPLGELFDHGCDAFLTPFVAVNASLAAKMSPWMTYAYMMQSTVGLFTAIWEQFSTGTFDLGYLSGPTEGILLVCGIFVVSGVATPAFFDTPVAGPFEFPLLPKVATHFLGVDPVAVRLESLRSFLMVFFFVPWLFTVGTNIAHAVFMPTVHRTRRIPLMAALPIAVAVLLNVAVYAAFPDAHAKFPFVFELSLALLVSYSVTRLTIARLCIMAYQPFSFYYLYTVMMYAAMLVLRVVSTPKLTPEMKDAYVGVAMLLLTLMGAFQYGRMIVTVFRQLADYLGIHIMHITPKPNVR